jgi:ribosomal protein S18 acetylase RimI-like enzyme
VRIIPEKKKPKVEKYLEELEDYNTEPLSRKEQTNKPSFPMKIRHILSPEEEKTHFLQAQIQEKSIQETPEQLCDYCYLQMRLDVINITPQYEKKLAQYRLQSMKVRIATEQDLSELTKVYNRSFMTGTDPYSPITQEHMQKIMEPPREIIVALGYGKILGFIILDFEGEDEICAIICGLGTDPAWRRRGVGKYLGYEAWNHIRDRNIREIRCEVYEKNLASISLIRSLDFEEYGQKCYKW